MSGSQAAIQDLLPLTPMQEGLLFHELHDPHLATYLVQVAVDLGGEVDDSALRDAWQHLVARHDALRSAVVLTHREPLQVIHAAASLPWEAVDWSGIPKSELDDRFEAWLQADRERGLELTRPPLARVAVFHLPGGARRLTWTFHHLALDGWSVAMLLDELAAVHDARRFGREPSLPPVPHYRDWLAWLQRQDRVAAQDWWRGALEQLDGATPLPFDRGPQRREPERDTDPLLTERRLELSRATSAGLRKWAAQHRLTLSTVLQGTWGLVLARWSGRDDVVFGATTSGRPADIPWVGRLAGLLINTLPVRVRLRPGADLAAWLGMLQQEQADARAFGHLPLPMIRACWRTSAAMPLFESLLIFESFPAEHSRFDGRALGLRLGRVRSVERTNYPLSLVVAPDEQLRLLGSWDPRRLDERAVSALLEDLGGLLEAVASGQVHRVEDLSPPQAGEQGLLFGPAPLSVTSSPLHRQFEMQAALSPDATAVVQGEVSLTYAELDAAAERLGRRLRAVGCGGEDVVGVCLERCPEAIVAILATLKAGAAWAVLDPDLPPLRLAELIAEASVAAMVSSAPYLERLARAPVPVISVYETDGEGADSNPGRGRNESQALAYVVFTSGSTGRPKAVMVSHAAISNTLSWRHSADPLAAGDAVLQGLSLSFDASVYEVFGPLVAGATVVLAPPGGHRDPRALFNAVRRHGVTHLQLTPGLARSALELHPEPPSNRLRSVVLGGEALRWDLLDRLRQEWGLTAANHYGPTEAAIDATSWRPDSGIPLDRAGSNTAPIGRPVAGMRAYVLDRSLRPLPPGAIGELYLAGAGLARGYRTRPAATASAFLPDPFVPGGQRMYRTGDLVRMRDDGLLEFMGRVDQQVKLQGIRLELGEVEHVLCAHPGVAEAVVAVQADEVGDRLVAWVVASHDATVPLGAGELIRHAQQRLPAWSVPASIVVLEDLPRTPGGKIDRRALPTVVPATQVSTAGAVTPTEQLVAAVFSQVLAIDPPGLHADFFASGGDSLRAMRAAAQLSRATGTDVSVRALFEYPVAAQLARQIDKRRAAARRVAPLPLRRAPRHDRIPATPAQASIWRLEQALPATSLFHMHLALHLVGSLSFQYIVAALRLVVERHEALRTVLAADDDGPVLVALDDQELPFRAVDLTGRPAGPERVQAALEEIAAEAQRPFDLARGPLFRAMLISLAEDDHVFQITMHHGIGDAASLDVVVREITEAYEALVQERPVRLPPVSLQLADYAWWHRRWLDDGLLNARLAWWRAQLRGRPPHLTPARRESAHQAVEFETGRESILLEPDLVVAMDALARRDGLTRFMFLMAAYAVALRPLLDRDEAWIGTLVDQRGQMETERLVGLLLGTLILRLDLTGTLRLRDLLRHVRDVTLDAWTHHEVPLEVLAPRVAEEPGVRPEELMPVMFVYQKARREFTTPADLAIRPLALDPGGSGVSLTTAGLILVVDEQGQENLSVSVRYRRHLFDERAAVALLERLRTASWTAIRAPDRRLSEIL